MRKKMYKIGKSGRVEKEEEEKAEGKGEKEDIFVA